MLTDIQTLPKEALLPGSLEVLSMSPLLDNSKPLQTQFLEPNVLPSYPESDYHWLVKVLDALIEFMHRDKNCSVPELTENDYEWAYALLVESIGTVGESVTHPLRPLMEFVCHLINNYEEKHVPELTELFPELTEETSIETASESCQLVVDTPKLNENELAAHAFFSIGYLLGEGNLTNEALVAYDKAIALKPDFVEAYNNRSGVFQKLGKYNQAIADLGKAIGVYPNFAELYCNLGCLKGSSGEPETATTDFDKAIELDPKNAKAYYYRGIAKNQLGEYQAAIIDFDKAVNLGFNSVNIYYYRALAKTLLNQHDVAIPDFDKAIKLNPKNTKAYNYRGNSNQELRHYDAALADYTKAIHINPNYAEAYNSRGNLRGTLGQYHDALADCTEAIRLKSDYAEAYANRGMAKISLGHIDKAKLDLQKALELGKQQEQVGLQALIEEHLQQLNLTEAEISPDSNEESTAKQAASKQSNKKPRYGGQWKGKVKIAEDFDELPESFMTVFRGEDE